MPIQYYKNACVGLAAGFYYLELSVTHVTLNKSDASQSIT